MVWSEVQFFFFFLWSCVINHTLFLLREILQAKYNNFRNNNISFVIPQIKPKAPEERKINEI